MPTPSSPSPEAIGAAWKAATEANLAFNELAAARLAATGRLGLDSAAIAPPGDEMRDQRVTMAQAKFDELVDQAAPVMLMPNSPFAVSAAKSASARAGRERAPNDLDPEAVALFEPGYLLISRGQIMAFARKRGYKQGPVTRSFNALWRALPHWEVADFRNYLRTAAKTSPQELAIIVEDDNRSNSQDDAISFDVRALRAAALEWIMTRDPDIEDLSEKGVSFFADLLNHAQPNQERLFVRYPIGAPGQAKAEAATSEQRTALLHRVEIGGVDTDLVSSVSLRRFFDEQGYEAGQASFIVQLFESIAAYLDPTARRSDYPLLVPGNVVRLDTRLSEAMGKSGSVWGIAPQVFIDLIERAEAEPAVRARLLRYADDFSRPIVRAYVAALKTYLAAETESS